MKITQNTLLPLSLVIALGYVIFAIGNSYSQITVNKNDISEVDDDIKAALKTLRNIELRLMKIETSIKLMAK